MATVGQIANILNSLCANTDTVLATEVFTVHTINPCLLNFCAAQVARPVLDKQRNVLCVCLYVARATQQLLYPP